MHSRRQQAAAALDASAEAAPPPVAHVTYVFRTPRGRTALAAVRRSAPYGEFVRVLLEAAARRDGDDDDDDLGHPGTSCWPAAAAMAMAKGRSVTPDVEAEPPLSSPKRRKTSSDLDRDSSAPTSRRSPVAAAAAVPVPVSLHVPLRVHVPEAAAMSASAYFVRGGKGFGREEYERMNADASNNDHAGGDVNANAASVASAASANREVHLTLRLRLLGGMTDRQNRAGSKFGGGGMASAANAERDRKERLRQLALESVDLAKDPYLMRNHLGSYECKLCLTLHTNEANYLAHTQGKKHQAGLARRAAMEKKRAALALAAGEGGSSAAAGAAGPMPLTAAGKGPAAQRRVRIGRPGYEVTKSRDPATRQRCLTFYLHYPEVDDPSAVQPRHRFMSAYEQRVESPPDGRYQYLLVACDPYETVAFKVPAEPIDRGEGQFVTNWDREERRFTLRFSYLDPKGEGGAAGAMEVG